MEGKTAAKLDETLRECGQNGAIDDETVDKVMDLFRDFEEFKKLSLDEMRKELEEE